MMTFWVWVCIAIAMLAAYGIGWIVGDDHGRNDAHREWTADAYAKHIETKYQLALAGLTINSHRTEQ